MRHMEFLGDVALARIRSVRVPYISTSTTPPLVSDGEHGGVERLPRSSSDECKKDLRSYLRINVDERILSHRNIQDVIHNSTIHFALFTIARPTPLP